MNAERILVIDDDAPLLEVIADCLSRKGYRIDTATTAAEAERLAEATAYDLFLLDYKMPGMNGIELMKLLRRIRPEAEAMIITGHATLEKGVEAIREGARDYVAKPLEAFELQHRVETIMERRRLRLALSRQEALGGQREDFGIVGVSAAIGRVRELARMAGPTRSTVLIEGESGTGKELVARAVHLAGDRAEQPFLAVNCGAIAAQLAERELFGHVKGAFTGAAAEMPGYFEAAGAGTLFLDEIGELSLDLQVKLLRVLDRQEVLRVGSTAARAVTARLIFATNRNLEEMVGRGEFRQDLFYRLNVIRIPLPPLRERREDVPLLAATFIRRAAARLGVATKPLAEDAMAVLEEHDWPGNARELENVIERALALGRGERLELADLPGWLLRSAPGAPEREQDQDFMNARRQAAERFDRQFLAAALQRHDGNISRTAEAIGLARSALQRFLRKYGLDREDFASRAEELHAEPPREKS